MLESRAAAVGVVAARARRGGPSEDLRKEHEVAHKPLRTGARVAVAVMIVAVAGGCASRKDREARRHGSGTIPLDRSVITGFTPDATAGARPRAAWTSPYAAAPAPAVTTTPRFAPVDATDSAAGSVIYAGAAPMPIPAAQAAQPYAAPAAAGGGARYTVVKGDTLFGIARTRYGSGGQWQRIAAANPGLSPETLKAGSTIVVP
jgi:nucleoid-associated protein YgaU